MHIQNISIFKNLDSNNVEISQIHYADHNIKLYFYQTDFPFNLKKMSIKGYKGYKFACPSIVSDQYNIHLFDTENNCRFFIKTNTFCYFHTKKIPFCSSKTSFKYFRVSGFKVNVLCYFTWTLTKSIFVCRKKNRQFPIEKARNKQV